jgi:hypothetical protein
VGEDAPPLGTAVGFLTRSPAPAVVVVFSAEKLLGGALGTVGAYLPYELLTSLLELRRPTVGRCRGRVAHRGRGRRRRRGRGGDGPAITARRSRRGDHGAAITARWRRRDDDGAAGPRPAVVVDELDVVAVGIEMNAAQGPA